jgi:hypothetical protein
MMTAIKDLFSHKIHSSSYDWADKLVELACIFDEFHGKPYDRNAIEKRLSEISPRASIVARDPSKFRDEISAYPAYLGLYRVELVDDGWYFFLSNTAKKFLVCEEPNVPAFMLLQMILFQYPNGMGVAYTSNSNKVRVQANACQRTLSFIQRKIHLSPFRLICKALLADSNIKSCSPLQSALSFDEIFVLANHPDVNQTANPNIEVLKAVILKARNKEILPPKPYESRFHILKHTNFLISENGFVRIRQGLNELDSTELLKKLEIINSIDVEFASFDLISDEHDLLNQINQCSWGRYFDGVSTLNANTVSILISDDIYESGEYQIQIAANQTGTSELQKHTSIYELKKRDEKYTNQLESKQKTPVFTDPEITKIRRQRSHLNHKILLQLLYEYLENIGTVLLENEHIDLYAKLATNDKFLFEVKSVTDSNLLSQTRKGISQLYEYRYRYQNVIGYDVNLCLVFPEEPTQVPWLQEYVCKDREIGIIWLDQSGDFGYSPYCESIVNSLIPKVDLKMS